MTDNQGKAAPRWSQQLPKGYEGKPEEFSMTMTMLVRTIRDGVTNSGPWIGITGLDQNGRFLKAATYGPFADIVKRQIESKMSPGADLEEEGIVLELRGSFYQRAAAEGGRADRQFRFSGFEFVTGPSNEMFRERQRAGSAVEDANKALEAGDLRGAYKAFEKFVCSFASVKEPSAEFGELFETDIEAFAEMADPVTGAATAETSEAIEAEVADRTFGVAEEDASEPAAPEVPATSEMAPEEQALAEMNGTRGFQPPPVARVVRPNGLGMRGRLGRNVASAASAPAADTGPTEAEASVENEAPREEPAKAPVAPMRSGLGMRRRM